jgi:16S rRNA C1402 (ribose-2'-O) methylase RsmI
MSVAKPWMLALPLPGMSQMLGEVPGRQFSRSISFAGAPHEAQALAGPTAARTAIVASAATATPTSFQGLVTMIAPMRMQQQRSERRVTRAAGRKDFGLLRS